MTSVELKKPEKSEISEVLANNKHLLDTTNKIQITVGVDQSRKPNMDKIKPKVIEAFDLDFIKQVCYENNVNYDTIKLLVIYEHDDDEIAVDAIFDQFHKLNKQFLDLNIEMAWYNTSEIKSSDLNNTTMIFKRD